ncbi:hypothetical protein Tco_0321080 [Tanacetum coccineum]
MMRIKTKNPSLDQTRGPREDELTTKDLEELAHQEFDTGVTKDQPNEETPQFPDWFQRPTKLPSPDRDWNKTLPNAHGPVQHWLSSLAQKEDLRESFNELMDTPLDFSAFVMNRLKITGTSNGLKIWSLTECEVKCRLAMTNMHSGEFHIGGENDNNSMSTPNAKSLLDDEKLYKFKEGDFNRLRIQDIEDMLLLLVQGKLTNLTVEECLAFNVSLRMFTRSVVIQRHVEDLKLGVKSYQKKLNLTKSKTYRPDLKRREAYTAYSNPRERFYTLAGNPVKEIRLKFNLPDHRILKDGGEDLPSQKHYRGTSELVEDDEEEDEEEDEEIEESSNYDSDSEDAKDEGPTTEDGDTIAGDEGLAAGDEGSGIRVESLGLGGDEAVHEGQQRATPVVETDVGKPLGLGYGALRCQELASREGQMRSVFEVGQGSRSVPEPERPKRVSALKQPTLTTWIDLEDDKVYIDVPAYPPPAPPVQTLPYPEWSSSLLLVSLTPSIAPLPISSPMIPLTVPLPVASPATAETEGFLTEFGAQVEMHGGLIHDHMVQLGELSPALFDRYDRDIRELFTRSGAVMDEIFSQRYRFRSLKHEQERVVVTFGAIWRPVLALESWAGQTDAQRATRWHAISDMQMKNQELRLQIVEERRTRLDLAEIVDSMRRGQEPRGDV